MKTGLLSFERVCTEYEFAAWELAELVERGEIAATLDGEGGMWFESAEIIRFIRDNPDRLFSFEIAEKIYHRASKTLRHQAAANRLRAKKIGKVWAVSTAAMNEYMEKHARS